MPVIHGKHTKKVAKLEKQLRAAQEALKRKDGDHRTAHAELRRVQAEFTRGRGPEESAAELLRELEAGLTRSPPTGVRPEYMAGFFARNRARLLNVVAGVLSQIG